MQFQREPIRNFIDDMFPLLEKHYQEIAHYHDIELNPDLEAYLANEEAGFLRTYTIRDHGKLVGYGVYFVRPNPHYKESLQAVQDVIYLDQPLRGNGEGMKFIAWCDEELKKDGVQVVYHHVKNKLNWGPALEKMGYKLMDLIYARRLD